MYEIWRGDIEGGPPEKLFIANSQARYAEPGYILFLRDGALRAFKFDKRSNLPVGAPLMVVDGVASILPIFRWGPFSVSQTGVLAYTPGGRSNQSRITWIDRQGRTLGTVGEPAAYSNPALSPDERQLAVDIREPRTEKRDIWLLDLIRGTHTRFTFEPGEDFCAVFSADGSRVLFASDRTGQRKPYVRSASGSEKEAPLADLVLNSLLSLSPDGRFLLFDIFDGSQSDFHLMDLTHQPPTANPLLTTPFNEVQACFSPDGNWIAYSSRESGGMEVYVQSYPPGKGRWQISNAGGTEPQWSGDGKELFYISGNRMMAVPIRLAAGNLEAGLPQQLFEANFSNIILRNRYVATRDGQKFLALIAKEEGKVRTINVIMNWPSLLEKQQ